MNRASIGIIGGADGPTAIFVTGKIFFFFRIAALTLMAFFYAVYLGKMIAQRRKGIRTDQMAVGKEKGKRYYTELLLKISTYTIIPVQLFSLFFAMTSPIPMRWLGLLLALLGDISFAAAVFTMRDSWRAGIPETDKTEFVQNGIFRWSRNPAFLGFDLMYIGILLMFFNIPLLLLTILAVTMLHLQILQEEVFLAETFGSSYREYKQHVLRYFGRKK